MSDNNSTKLPVKKLNIPEMPVEERIKYISDDMIYNEEELAFIRTRDKVAERTAARLDESLARSREFSVKTEESLTRDREFLERSRKAAAEIDALMEKFRSKQKGK